MMPERPSTLEDAVVYYHTGSWFKWTDIYNKTYANLRLHEKVWNSDGTELIDNPITELPTEEELNAKLVELQTTWDENNQSHKLNRFAEYPDVKEQLAMLYHDIDSGKFGVNAKKSSFYKSIKSVKSKYPKPS